MHADHLAPMVDDLCSLGRLGADILTACNAKEDLLDLLALARTHPDRRAIAERLHRFYTRCAEAGLPELERLATTVETWWPQILAFIHTGITNAGSEATIRCLVRMVDTGADHDGGGRRPCTRTWRAPTSAPFLVSCTPSTRYQFSRRRGPG